MQGGAHGGRHHYCGLDLNMGWKDIHRQQQRDRASEVGETLSASSPTALLSFSVSGDSQGSSPRTHHEAVMLLCWRHSRQLSLLHQACAGFVNELTVGRCDDPSCTPPPSFWGFAQSVSHPVCSVSLWLGPLLLSHSQALPFLILLFFPHGLQLPPPPPPFITPGSLPQHLKRRSRGPPHPSHPPSCHANCPLPCQIPVIVPQHLWSHHPWNDPLSLSCPSSSWTLSTLCYQFSWALASLSTVLVLLPVILLLSVSPGPSSALKRCLPQAPSLALLLPGPMNNSLVAPPALLPPALPSGMDGWISDSSPSLQHSLLRGMVGKSPFATSSSQCPCLKAVSLSQYQPTLPSPEQLESLRMVTQLSSPPFSNPSALLPN